MTRYTHPLTKSTYYFSNKPHIRKLPMGWAVFDGIENSRYKHEPLVHYFYPVCVFYRPTLHEVISILR